MNEQGPPPSVELEPAATIEPNSDSVAFDARLEELRAGSQARLVKWKKSGATVQAATSRSTGRHGIAGQEFSQDPVDWSPLGQPPQ